MFSSVGFVLTSILDHKSGLAALRSALDNLETLFTTIGVAYQKDLDRGAFERFEEPGASEDELRAIVQRGEEIRQELRKQGKPAPTA